MAKLFLQDLANVELGRRHRLALAQNIVEVLAGDTEEPRNLSLCSASGWNDILPQQSTGMGRTPIRITLGNMNHNCLSSVILFEVDAAGVTVFEFERDAPWSIYMDQIARRFGASQGMEIKAGLLFLSCGRQQRCLSRCSAVEIHAVFWWLPLFARGPEQLVALHRSATDASPL